jgi:hypothetical protein
MDKKEWLNRPMGIPVDPAKQKDPEEHGDRVPAEGRAERLNDVTGQNGGQISEISGHPTEDEGVHGKGGAFERYGGRGEPEDAD